MTSLLSLVVLFTFLAGCYQQVSNRVPEYPSVCPDISPVQEFDTEVLIGSVYEVMSSTNVNYSCSMYYNVPMGNGSFLGNATSIVNSNIVRRHYVIDMIDEKKYPLGFLVNIEAGADEFYSVPLYVMGFNQTFVTYTCYKKGEKKIEEIHVYGKSLNYDKNFVLQILKKENLQYIQVRDGFINCPDGYLSS